jgi:hypothetical protein
MYQLLRRPKSTLLIHEPEEDSDEEQELDAFLDRFNLHKQCVLVEYLNIYLKRSTVLSPVTGTIDHLLPSELSISQYEELEPATEDDDEVCICSLFPHFTYLNEHSGHRCGHTRRG